MYDLDFKTENNDKSKRKTGEELMQVYKDFVTNYPMVSIEDPFDQDDFPTCARLQLHPTPRLQLHPTSPLWMTSPRAPRRRTLLVGFYTHTRTHAHTHTHTHTHFGVLTRTRTPTPTRTPTRTAAGTPR